MSETGRTPKLGIVYGLSAVGLLIVVLASAGPKVTSVPLDAEFGLLQLLPVSYAIGITFMGIAFVVALRSDSQTAFAVTGLVLFASFAATPILFEVNPPVWDGYTHLASAQVIVRSGHLHSDPGEYAANWPGLFILVAFQTVVGGVDGISMLRLFPVLTGGLTFLSLFVFLRSFFPQSIARLGAATGSFFAVWAQFHLSPQSVGLILMLLTLGTVLRESVYSRAAGSLLFVGLVVTHPTSSFLLLCVFVADAALSRAARGKSRSHPSSAGSVNGLTQTPALAFGVSWLGWLFFRASGSSRVAETGILDRMVSILQVPEQTINIATARTVESIFNWAPIIRFSSLAIFVTTGIVALIALSRTRRHRRLAQFLWATLAGLVLAGFLDIFAFGGLLYDRSLMLFALVMPATCFAGIGVWRVRKLARQTILAVVVVAALVTAATAYYQEALYFVSDESVAVSEFLEQTAPGPLILDGLFPAPVWLDTDSSIRGSLLGFYAIYPQTFSELQGYTDAYAVFDDTARLWYVQSRGVDIYSFYEVQQSQLSLIYANGRADIYFIPALGPSG